jgi:hypothetical protein
MNEQEKQQLERETLAYLNKTPELLSLLYDLDLMPEQLVKRSSQWNQMLILSNWHRNKSLREDIENAKK